MFNPITDYSIADFKAFFYRDFTYLPYYVSGQTYVLNTIVYYTNTSIFYKCKVATTTDLPTNTTSWDVLNPQSNIYDYIIDQDITKAINEAIVIFDVNLGFDTDAKAKLVFNYLTAHFLSITLSLNNANDGSSGIVSAKSVGNVSESFTIPEWMQKGSYALYRGSKYGVKYAELTKSLRYAKSLFFVAEGSTNPVIN